MKIIKFENLKALKLEIQDLSLQKAKKINGGNQPMCPDPEPPLPPKPPSWLYKTRRL